MSDCEHKQLVLTSQRGTDGLPIYSCGVPLAVTKLIAKWHDEANRMPNAHGVIVDRMAYELELLMPSGCGALFKVKPEEITVEFAATTPTTPDWMKREIEDGVAPGTYAPDDDDAVAPPREEVRALVAKLRKRDIAESAYKDGQFWKDLYALLDKLDEAALAATNTAQHSPTQPDELREYLLRVPPPQWQYDEVLRMAATPTLRVQP